MTFTGKSATSLPSPQECEASEFVLDAWRIILAQTLDAKEAEWDAHCRLMQANYEAMQAKSEAVIAGLQARVAELDGTIKGMVAIRLGELKDGERGPQGERGERGETGDSGEDGEDGIDGLCGDRGATMPLGSPRRYRLGHVESLARGHLRSRWNLVPAP